MTVGDAITKIAELKPHTYSNAVLAGWLSEVDGKFWIETICWHDDTAVVVEYDDDGVLITDMPQPAIYDATEDTATALLIPSPYDDLYLQYLAAKIDYWNGEIGRYNNAMAMFNASYVEYGNYYNRTHTPKQPTQQEI